MTIIYSQDQGSKRVDNVKRLNWRGNTLMVEDSLGTKAEFPNVKTVECIHDEEPTKPLVISDLFNPGTQGQQGQQQGAQHQQGQLATAGTGQGGNQTQGQGQAQR